MNAELRSIPASDPNRNFFPSSRAPRTNSGTFSSIVSTPMEPKPRSSRRIIARPLMPPTFRLFGSRNRSKPSAKIAQPRVIFHPICQMVLHVSRFKPSSSLLCSCGFYHSLRQMSSFIWVSPISSGRTSAPAAGSVRAE